MPAILFDLLDQLSKKQKGRQSTDDSKQGKQPNFSKELTSDSEF